MKKLLLLLALLCVAAPARAQMPGLPGLTPAKPEPVAAVPSIAPAQAQATLDVLKDEAQRARLIGVLETIAKAQPQPAAAAPVVPAVLPLKPDGLGAQVLVGASQYLSMATAEVVHLARAVNDFPLLLNWVSRLLTDPDMQMAILDATWRLAVVFGMGLLVEFLVARLLRPVRQTLARRAPGAQEAAGEEEPDESVAGIAEAEAGQTEWHRKRASAVLTMRRLPYALANLVVDVLPVLALVATGYGMLAAGLDGRITARLVILAVLDAYLVWRVLVALAQAVAAPRAPKLRLLPLSESQAAAVVREVSVLAAVAIAGGVLAETALLFGLYRVAHDALLKLDALVVYGLVIGIVLRNRRGLRNWLRPRPGSSGVFAYLRNALAGSWDRIIIFYLGALWLVWVLEIPDGFARFLRFAVVAVAIGGVARLATLVVYALLDRGLKASTGLAEKYPGLDHRVASYHPLARGTASLLIGVVALMVLFQSWGLDAFDWFANGGLGGRVIAALGSIVFTLVAALAVWEATNISIQRHLSRLAREAQMARSARLRTFLPMLRTTLLAAVCIVAGLMILSQIGINIAPLLAGAGVIGIAIGFGSQKLVQDIITGLFLLLENTMQVGDVVSLGGMTGTVETLSIRTIRLRAVDGAVHMVPFSAVTTVTNMTRDFGFAVLDLSVGLNEEPDRVAEVLREVANAMRAEPAWKSVVLADLEVMGVEKFIDTAWVMKIRIKTLPASRWSVGRELNRRVKYRFDELAIESPMTSYRALGMAKLPQEPETSQPSGAEPAHG